MTVKNISPWGNFTMDDETGLPLLPEPDLFFRVTRIVGGWQVQLRRKTFYGFSRVEESRTYTKEPATEKTVLDGSTHALTKYLERPLNQSNYSLLGDYPPKKLGQP